MRKIGIMGGTFDPIHNGHMMLAEYAYRTFQLDEVWFMPNGRPPHKKFSSIESDVNTRLTMVKLAIKDYPEYYLETYEALAEHTCCTYSTMEHFKELYPNDEFYFIIGADSLQMLDTWVHPERIFPTCIFIATCRDEIDNEDAMVVRIHDLESRYEKADIKYMRTPIVPISSRDLRKKIKDGISIEKDVPPAVYEFIKEHGLYKS